MSAVTEQVQRNADTRPLENLEEQVRKELESAVLAHRNGSKVYQSLQNLNEVDRIQDERRGLAIAGTD